MESDNYEGESRSIVKYKEHCPMSMCGGGAVFLNYFDHLFLFLLPHIGEIYTTIKTTDELRNASVTNVGVAGLAGALHGKQT